MPFRRSGNNRLTFEGVSTTSTSVLPRDILLDMFLCSQYHLSVAGSTPCCSNNHNRPVSNGTVPPSYGLAFPVGGQSRHRSYIDVLRGDEAVARMYATRLNVDRNGLPVGRHRARAGGHWMWW
ncbi:MAG: hypothetical protein IPF59_14100 [Ignavibacteria bacterium]|nr:hypothetical protein [Ignavibacteria bacterium]